MLNLKTLPVSEKLRLKNRENILRFETHAILKGIRPTEEMKVRVRQACENFYTAYPDEITVPSDVLIEAGLGETRVELNI